MIDVYWLSLTDAPANPAEYWDMSMLSWLLNGDLWPVRGYEFRHIESHGELPEDASKYAVVVIPGRYHYDKITELNTFLAHFEGVVFAVCGDEEGKFPYEQLEHPKLCLWAMTPHAPIKNATFYLGSGWPAQAPAMLKDAYLEAEIRRLDWFFAGQITHSRREEAAAQMRGMSNGYLLETPGFTKGLEHTEYYRLMASSKVVPCPSGPESPDSFRVYEALEAGCIPVADATTPKDDVEDYWGLIFGATPFPTIKNWESLPAYTKDLVAGWPRNANAIYAWWQQYKYWLANGLHGHLRGLGAEPSAVEQVAVVITTSPIPSHPSTAITEETIANARFHFPDAPIYLLFDGVRPGQDRAQYDEYTRRMLWKCNFEYKNVLPVIFPDHQHQVGMLRHALETYINAPLLLFLEHDTPLVIDEPIDWAVITNKLETGEFDLVRFHFEALIPEPHQHLMIDKEPVDNFIRTAQWSQRPHLASTSFYRRVLQDNFTENANCFIEDKMHSVAQELFLKDGINGWYNYRLAIYAPEGNFKRSYHTDGRAGEEKYDGMQVF